MKAIQLVSGVKPEVFSTRLDGAQASGVVRMYYIMLQHCDRNKARCNDSL
jgi:hypothetical protein